MTRILGQWHSNGHIESMIERLSDPVFRWTPRSGAVFAALAERYILLALEYWMARPSPSQGRDGAQIHPLLNIIARPLC